MSKLPVTANNKALSVTLDTTNYLGAKFEFGDDLPLECPPKHAFYGPKLLFRLVRKTELNDADFRTTREEGKFKNGDACQRCSISTFESEEAAKIVRRAVPNLFGTKIAKGVVPKEAGKVLNTPSSLSTEHWSWWPTISITRSAYFEIVDEAA